MSTKNVFTLSKILDKIKNLRLDLDSTKQELQDLNSKNLYVDSDDEIIIGSYCGKPIYRKRVLNGETVSSGVYELDVSSLHIELLLNIFGCIKGGYGNLFPIGFSDGANSDAAVYLPYTGILTITHRITGTLTGYCGYTYIEYTKSTD